MTTGGEGILPMLLFFLSHLANILIVDEHRVALRDARDHLTLFETMISLG